MPNVTFVLLHGAGIGPWAWQPAIESMEGTAIALDVPGRRPGVTPDGCAAELVREIDALGVGEVVIVAHSLSGVLVPGIAARLGPRLRRSVYLAAIVPSDGGSFLDALGPVERLVMRLLFRFNRDGLRPSPSMIRDSLCNDLDEETTAIVIERYAPEYPGLYLEPVIGGPPARATYIRLTNDRSVPPSKQDVMVRRLREPRIRELDSGHLAMLSRPAELAAILDEEVG